jgi:hypothetical protein
MVGGGGGGKQKALFDAKPPREPEVDGVLSQVRKEEKKSLHF